MVSSASQASRRQDMRSVTPVASFLTIWQLVALLPPQEVENSRPSMPWRSVCGPSGSFSCTSPVQNSLRPSRRAFSITRLSWPLEKVLPCCRWGVWFLVLGLCGGT